MQWLWILVLVFGIPLVFFGTYKLVQQGNRTWWSNINSGLFTFLAAAVPVLAGMDWSSYMAPIAAAVVAGLFQVLNQWIRTKTSTPFRSQTPTESE